MARRLEADRAAEVRLRLAAPKAVRSSLAGLREANLRLTYFGRQRVAAEFWRTRAIVFFN